MERPRIETCGECAIPESGAIFCVPHNKPKGRRATTLCQTNPRYRTIDRCVAKGDKKKLPTKHLALEKALEVLYSLPAKVGGSEPIDSARSLEEALECLKKCRACPTFNSKRSVCDEDKGCGARRVFLLRLIKRNCSGWVEGCGCDNPSPRRTSQCK